MEFRTVVQNMVNQEQHLKMSFSIKDANGITIKYHEEKEFTIRHLVIGMIRMQRESLFPWFLAMSQAWSKVIY